MVASACAQVAYTSNNALMPSGSTHEWNSAVWSPVAGASGPLPGDTITAAFSGNTSRNLRILESGGLIGGSPAGPANATRRISTLGGGTAQNSDSMVIAAGVAGYHSSTTFKLEVDSINVSKMNWRFANSTASAANDSTRMDVKVGRISLSGATPVSVQFGTATSAINNARVGHITLDGSNNLKTVNFGSVTGNVEITGEVSLTVAAGSNQINFTGIGGDIILAARDSGLMFGRLNMDAVLGSSDIIFTGLDNIGAGEFVLMSWDSLTGTATAGDILASIEAVPGVTFSLNDGLNAIIASRPLGTPAEITVDSIPRQQMTFGADLERLWWWNRLWSPAYKDAVSQFAVGDLQVEYLRVAITCGYEREEGVINAAAYASILDMMNAMKQKNPGIKFFGSPQPLMESYTDDELATIWNGTAVPWSPYPVWVLPWTWNGTSWQRGTLDRDKLVRYLSDYVNFMHTQGHRIDYLDLINEQLAVTPADAQYVSANLQSHLNPGVHMPLLVAPSTWSLEQAAAFINNSDIGHFDVVGAHNTGGPSDEATAAKVVDAARGIDAPAWNTEMHAWIGRPAEIEKQILTSKVLWEHIRAGFSGIDTWLFIGNINGTDHSMLNVKVGGGEPAYTTTKYEIFEKLVNTAGGGYYQKIPKPSQQVFTTSFIKGNVMTVWILNAGSSKPVYTFNTGNRPISGSLIESHFWSPGGDKYGESFTFAKDGDRTFTREILPKHLYCFKFDVTPIPSVRIRSAAINRVLQAVPEYIDSEFGMKVGAIHYTVTGPSVQWQLHPIAGTDTFHLYNMDHDVYLDCTNTETLGGVDGSVVVRGLPTYTDSPGSRWRKIVIGNRFHLYNPAMNKYLRCTSVNQSGSTKVLVGVNTDMTTDSTRWYEY